MLSGIAKKERSWVYGNSSLMGEAGIAPGLYSDIQSLLSASFPQTGCCNGHCCCQINVEVTAGCMFCFRVFMCGCCCG